MAKKILLVDDEEDLVEAVSFRLTSQGYDVITAYDGGQALEKAKKERPDLIILDLMLPGMNGYEVCAHLKADAQYAAIPIILFTARAQESDREMGFKAGANGYLTKPFDSEMLMTTIRSLLNT